MLFDHDGCECTAKRKRKIRMTEDERNQYESTLWELEHDGYIDAPNLIRQQQAEIEALKAIVERLTADWTDGFRNYEYNSSPEENKLRDDVFAILRKASEKCLTFYAE